MSAIGSPPSSSISPAIVATLEALTAVGNRDQAERVTSRLEAQMALVAVFASGPSQSPGCFLIRTWAERWRVEKMRLLSS